MENKEATEERYSDEDLEVALVEVTTDADRRIEENARVYFLFNTPQ